MVFPEVPSCYWENRTSATWSKPCIDRRSELISWVVKMAEIGYGQTRIQVTEMVKKILDWTGRPNPFQDNHPGKDWWYMFLHRYPEVSLKTHQALQICRASSCTAEVMDKWYSDYEQFLLIHDLYNRPDQIWNADESGFPLCPKSGKILAPKGEKHVYHVTGSSKQQITTLVCINAAGGTIPPMHIFPGVRFSYNRMELTLVSLTVDGLLRSYSMDGYNHHP